MRLFVRHLQIAPDLRCLAERRRPHPSTSPSARRTAPVACADVAYRSEAPMRACDRRQLCGSRPRVFEITGGQQDVDGRGKHSVRGPLVPACRAERCGSTRRRHRSRPCARRSSDSPGCGFRPRSLALRVRRFGLLELTAKSVNLAEAVERRARRRPGYQQLAGVLRVPGGFIPACRATA